LRLTAPRQGVESGAASASGKRKQEASKATTDRTSDRSYQAGVY